MIIKTSIGDFDVRKINNFGGLDLYNEKQNIRTHATYHKSVNTFSVGEIKNIGEDTRDMIKEALQKYANTNEDWEIELKIKNIFESMDKLEKKIKDIREIIDKEGWDGLYKREEKEKEEKAKCTTPC